MKVGWYTPVWAVVSLYMEILPHTAILPKFFICCKATVEKWPPTYNREEVRREQNHNDEV